MVLLILCLRPPSTFASLLLHLHFLVDHSEFLPEKHKAKIPPEFDQFQLEKKSTPLSVLTSSFWIFTRETRHGISNFCLEFLKFHEFEISLKHYTSFSSYLIILIFLPEKLRYSGTWSALQIVWIVTIERTVKFFSGPLSVRQVSLFVMLPLLWVWNILW